MRWASFFALMFMGSTKLSDSNKLSAEDETHPITNVLLHFVTVIVEFQ